jgi:hypothetical protein
MDFNVILVGALDRTGSAIRGAWYYGTFGGVRNEGTFVARMAE